MSAFQIHKDGAAVSISEIDSIAARFWGVEEHPKYYASPKGSSMNWFNTIGYAIAEQGNYVSGWRNVICTFQSILLEGIVCGPDKTINTMELTKEIASSIIENTWPFVELCKHFQELGLVPVKL